MKANKFHIIKWLSFFASLGIIYYYTVTIVQPELIFHRQQPPFLSTFSFFLQYITYPGGLTEYISNFLSQFFYFGWAGAFIILFTGVGIFFLGLNIFNSLKINYLEYIIAFIPAILLISFFNNCFFPYSVAFNVLLIYLTTWLYNEIIKKSSKEYIWLIILSICIYYFAGGNALMLFLINACIIAFLIKGKNKGFLNVGIALLIYLILPYISFKFIFNITIKNAYFSLFPDVINMMKYKQTGFFHTFYYYLPTVLLIIALSSVIFKRKKLNRLTEEEANILPDELSFKIKESYIQTDRNIWFKVSINFILILIFSVLIFFKAQNKHEKNIVLADYYCYTKQWNKVVDIAVSDPDYDIYLNFFYNRAIANIGNYFDLFFNYPQLAGAEILHPDNNISSPLTALNVSNYYFDLGYISESQHWAYAALTIMPNNTEAIKQLVITNLIYGNYVASQSLLKTLSKTFFTKEFVDHYMPYTKDTNLVASNNLIMQKRKSMPQNKLISPLMEDKFKDLLNQNPDNKLAFEHLQMNYLLKSQFVPFLEYFPEGRRFYSDRPELFDEAILIYFLQTDPQKIKSVKINPAVQRRIQNYNRILNQYNGNKEAAQMSLFKECGSNYIYYLTYFSPLVTNSQKEEFEMYK